MDWQTLRRQRLAKASSSHEATQRRGWLRNALRGAGDLVRALAAGPSWEKGIIVGGIALVAVLATVGFFVFAGGGSDDGAPQVTADPTATTAAVYVIDQPTGEDPATSTPEATSTAGLEATPTAQPTVAQLANREDCDAIRGTPYQSPAERWWFAVNCTDSNPSVTNPPGSLPPAPAPTATATTVSPPPVWPTAVPTPSPTPSGPSNSQLISIAANWLEQDAPQFDVLEGTCAVSPLASAQWIVSCQTQPLGCQSGCFQVTATVCITSPTFTVWRC